MGMIGPGGVGTWIAVTVPAPLLFFDATHRWEEDRSASFAAWWCVAGVALLAVALAVRRAAGRSRGLRDRAVTVATATLLSMSLLGASLAVYWWVIPLQGTAGWRGVLAGGVAAAVVGSLVGTLIGARGVRGGRYPARVGYLVGAIAVVGGALLAQTTVRLGAEDSTISYDEGRYGGPGVLNLPAAGQYAILAVGFSSLRPDCSIAGVGRAERVTVPPSDYGGDAATYAWVASFRVPGPGAYTMTCRASGGDGSYVVGDIPRIRGAVSAMIHWPLAGIWLLGAVPGLLILADVAGDSAVTLLRRRRPVAADEGAAH
jgi:hypothetical protein